MELEKPKRCFTYLLGITKISKFISDRHRGIAKWIRTCHPAVKNYYDIWHIAIAVIKKMLKTSKEKGCEIISQWTRGVRNHIYWCSTSTNEGFQMKGQFRKLGQ
jgi:solute carrier family 8 (sodium/calcium exchanger)